MFLFFNHILTKTIFKMKKTINYLFVLLSIIFITACNSGVSDKKDSLGEKDNTNATTIEKAEISNLTGNEKIILLNTNFGDIKIALYDGTPKHRDNFIKLVSESYFNDLLFHRVINSFMIQGGDPNSKNAKPDVMLGEGGPGYTIPAEFKSEYIHKKGVIAAAREGDNVNPEKASAGSQFYIVQGKKWDDKNLDKIEKANNINYSLGQRNIYKTIGGTPFLDNNYTVFGEVIEGIEVVDKIASVETNNYDRPVEDVKMTIKILK